MVYNNLHANNFALPKEESFTQALKGFYKLKEKGTVSWTRFEDVWGTNESGFTAKAGGCRMPTGIWGTPGLFATGFWWSSTEKQDGKLWYRHLDYKRSDVFRQYGNSNYGFSVRCIKE